MGQDKRWIEWDGVSLLRRVVSDLQGVFERVVVVGADRTWAEEGVEFLEDGWPGQGPVGGIVTALERFPGQDLFVAAGDMPSLSLPLVHVLCAVTAPVDRVVPEGVKGVEPLFGVYRAPALSVLRELLFSGKGGLQSVPLEQMVLPLAQLGEQGVITPWSLRSINTPEDLEEYLAFESTAFSR